MEIPLALVETTRRGFYVYDEKCRANPDPEIKKYVEKAREIAGVTIDPKATSSFVLLCYYNDCTFRPLNILI